MVHVTIGLFKTFVIDNNFIPHFGNRSLTNQLLGSDRLDIHILLKEWEFPVSVSLQVNFLWVECINL